MTDIPPSLASALAGRYTVERELGRGGMATVYLARDVRHGRRVAIKVLRPELAATVGPERFLREIQIAAGLTHPHILPLFDSGEVPLAHEGRDGTPAAPGLLYYVMPFVEGESLRERLTRETQLPLAEALRITRNVAAALGAAHSHGIVHRDIKPENILLADGEAMVADFGIARALHAAAGETLSEPGLIVGTPVYMSPEQGSGGEVGPRSDVYSLGCVLYEMLAGEPPFTGPTAQSIIARQQTERPRPLRTVRPELPAEIEDVVFGALAKVPAERYQTAGGFADALDAAAAVGGAQLSGRHRGPGPGARRGWPRWPWVGGAVGVLIAGGLVFSARARAAPYDEALVMVAPFAHRGAVAPELLDGELCELLLHRAVGHWDGIRLVDPLWVADARARRGIRDVRLEDALALARERRAGRLLTGHMYRVRDTLFIYAALYDVRRQTTIRAATVALAPDLHDATARFSALARSLVAGVATPGEEADDTAGTRSVDAWRQFDAGMRAFRRWQLDTAATHFDAAIAADGRYPQPRLWRAQLGLLTGEDDGWRVLARQAGDLAGALPPVEAARARALRALADDRFSEACEEYEALVRRDSLDFLAWFGLGECRQRDRLVVADAASPSGWRFRSSPQSAVGAYRRALEVLPSSHALFRGRAFTRLGELFLTEPTYFRVGYTVRGDTVRFGAWPGLDADSLLLIPYPLDRLLADPLGTAPPTHAAAIVRGRALQREVAAAWVRAFPNSADAGEALALAYESAGQLDGTTGANNALAETRRARGLAADGSHRVRLGVAEVRLLLKRERFAEARRLGDSLVTAGRHVAAEDARLLAGVAAALGRVHLAAELAGRAAREPATMLAWDGTLVSAPPPVAEASAAFLAYASLGSPADSIRAQHARAMRLVDSYFPRAEQTGARDALLGRAEDFAYFDAGVAPSDSGTPAGYLRQMIWTLARGDTAAVGRRMRGLLAARAGRPGEVTLDGTLLEALLLVAIGDSTAAARHLDAALTTLPALGAGLLRDVTLASSLGRAMMLRARLAAAAGDSPTARRWAGAVAELWSGCDEPLRAALSDMQALRS